MEPIQIILDAILERMGLSDMPPEQKAQYKEPLRELVVLTLDNTLRTTLTPDEEAEWDKHANIEEKLNTYYAKLATNDEKQVILAEAIESMVERLTKQPV